ncbi:MAG TPA: AraC family transcriptional regulator, partial [Pseudomonadales bacterium]|nr:AraC family transcriptional regulator [Pseudomonadales bacterium]
MPISSGWPLPPSGIRFFVPRFAVDQLAQHALARQLYPHGMGLYPRALGHRMHRLAAEHEDHLLMFCARGRGVLDAFGHRSVVEAGGLILLPRG